MQVRDRVNRAKRAVLRARYAAVGGAIGGLVGALVGELRADPGERIAAAAAESKEQLEERVPVRS